MRITSMMWGREVLCKGVAVHEDWSMIFSAGARVRTISREAYSG